MNEGTNSTGPPPQPPLAENGIPANDSVNLFKQPTDLYTPAAQPPEVAPMQPEASWSASEFIAHEKGIFWYIALAIIALAIAILVFLFTHDWFSLVAVAAALIVFGVMAVRKPRTIAYHIGSQGLTVNGHVYGFGIFRSFGFQDEGTFSSLVFMPMKRFMLPLYVYFPPEQRDHIMEVLAHYIPFSPVQQSAIERMTHRIRF